MNNVIEAVVVKEEVLDAIVKRENIAAPTAATLLASFAPYRGEIETALTEARGITDDTDVEQRKKARECRLTLKRIRVNVENTRKTSKEDAVRYGKAVDGMANVLKFLCEPEEKRLGALEEAEQRRELERIASMVADRRDRILKEGGNPFLYSLETMSDEDFGVVYNGLVLARHAREEIAIKAEAARVAKEKEEAEAREAQRIENERRKKEAASKIEREKAEAVLREMVAKLNEERKAREAAEAATRAAKQAAELELAKERKAAAKKQAAAEETLRQKRMALAKVAKEEQAAKVAAEKAEKAAAAKAARAPDKQKLLVWLGKFQAVLGELPGLRTGEGKNALIAVMASANDLIRVTETEIEGL